MNYIAHIHLAHVSDTSAVGAFLGDFVKGRNYLSLDQPHQVGVLLHRSIDQYTDSHAAIQEAKTWFPKDLRRMSGVVLDIYLDHLLITHLKRENSATLEKMLSNFYRELEVFEAPVSRRFEGVKASFSRHKWLMDYATRETCLQAFRSIEKRLSYKVTFADSAFAFVSENDVRLQKLYSTFYPDLQAYALSQAKQVLATLAE